MMELLLCLICQGWSALQARQRTGPGRGSATPSVASSCALGLLHVLLELLLCRLLLHGSKELPRVHGTAGPSL
jgi:hypothetical protein